MTLGTRRLKVLEAGVIVAGNFLALRTLFAYSFISDRWPQFYALPISLVASFLMLYLVNEGTTSLFSLNLLLYLPAVLSISEINWTFYYGYEPMALGTLSMNVFRTSMSFIELLTIGLVLLAGYVMLSLTSELRDEPHVGGVRGDDDIVSSYANVVFSIVAISLALTIAAAVLVEGINFLLR